MSQSVTNLKRCHIKLKSLADASHLSLFVRTDVSVGCSWLFQIFGKDSYHIESPVTSLPLPLLIHLTVSHGHLFQVSEHSPDSPPHKRRLVSTGTRIHFISFFLPSGFVSASAAMTPSLAVNSSMHISLHRCSDSRRGQRKIAGQIVPHKAESRWHLCWLCERGLCADLSAGAGTANCSWKLLPVALKLCGAQCPGTDQRHHHCYYFMQGEEPIVFFSPMQPKIPAFIMKTPFLTKQKLAELYYFFRSIPQIPFSDFVSVRLICIWGNP